MHRCLCLDNQLYERIGINIKESVFERLSSPLTNLLACFQSHSLGQNNLVHLSDKQMEYYLSLGSKLNKALCSNEFGHDILANSYLSELLVFINSLYQISTYIGKNIMPELVHDTMAYVEDHLTEDITLKQLSQKFCFNGAYISRIFKEHTGLTLRSYILEQRLTLAKRLLAQGKNVSEACYMSGFMDYANFIRSFTKFVGTSPGKYKQK
jgi:YesN/AraC family two-component response regulator